jgi:hypothetical protein
MLHAYALPSGLRIRGKEVNRRKRAGSISESRSETLYGTEAPMRTPRLAVPALLTATALAAACSDVAPLTEPVSFPEEASLFGAAPQRGGSAEAFGLDAEFVRIAREHPGFGGLFFGEDGALNIVSTGVQPMSLRTLAPSLSGLGVDATAQPVSFVEGQYDFVQLNAMHRSVSAVLGLRGVVFTDADEQRNRVVVGVEDAAAAAAVEQAVAMLGLPEGAVIIERTEPIEPLQTLQNRVRPIGGGLQIWRFIPPSQASICTLGFNVRSVGGGVSGIVTNSHCTEQRGVVTGTEWSQKELALPVEPIAIEEFDLPFFQGGVCPVGRNCRYSDAAGGRHVDGVDYLLGAIYKTTAPSQHTPGPLTIDPVNPRFTIVEERPFPMVGEIAHKVGRTTGWLIGPVIGTCQLTNVAGAGNISILCQDRVEATSQGGDSGSPVFFRVGETLDVHLVGILWGGSTNTYVFSSMQNVRCENVGPTNWITFPGQTPPAPTCPAQVGRAASAKERPGRYAPAVPLCPKNSYVLRRGPQAFSHSDRGASSTDNLLKLVILQLGERLPGRHSSG